MRSASASAAALARAALAAARAAAAAPLHAHAHAPLAPATSAQQLAERAASHALAGPSRQWVWGCGSVRHASDHAHGGSGSSASCPECRDHSHAAGSHDHDHSHSGHSHSPSSGGKTSTTISGGGGGSSTAKSGGGGSTSFEAQEATCWSCNDRHKRGSLLCQACDKIQPVDGSLTYFDLIGIDPTFDIDPVALERRYKLLQWVLHPDKAVARTPAEQDFSAAHASHINQAYGVLRAPLSRANYMLMLTGVPAGDHFEGTLEDPELLMEVMEARERVESTDDPRELQGLMDGARQQQRRIEAGLSAAFRADDLQRAAQLVAQLTYYVRLEEAIAAKL